jgi:hypothetical protein
MTLPGGRCFAKASSPTDGDKDRTFVLDTVTK